MRFSTAAFLAFAATVTATPIANDKRQISNSSSNDLDNVLENLQGNSNNLNVDEILDELLSSNSFNLNDFDLNDFNDVFQSSFNEDNIVELLEELQLNGLSSSNVDSFDLGGFANAFNSQFDGSWNQDEIELLLEELSGQDLFSSLDLNNNDLDLSNNDLNLGNSNVAEIQEETEISV